MPTGHGRRRHPSKVYSRSTHSGYREDVGTGALDSKEREGLSWSEARDGEQMQLPDIGPDAVDGAVHIRPYSLRRVLFAETIIPPEIVGVLPTLPDAAYPQGVLVFLTSDEKLYRNTDGSTWSVAVATSDLTGQITETQIADNSISTPKLQAGSVETDNLAANAVTAAKIAADTITAGQIAAGAISTSELAAGAVTAAKIAADTITANEISAGAIGTAELSASAVIANVLNVGSTVEIDSTGISITDGALTLLDSYDGTVLTGGGFAGSWVDFVTHGIYNSTFRNGPGNGVTIDNTTAPLAYWEVSKVGAAAASYAVHATRSDTASGFAVRLGITGTSGSSSDEVVISQLVPIPLQYPFSSDNRNAFRVQAHAVVTNASANMEFKVRLRPFKADGVTQTGSSTTDVSVNPTPGAAVITALTTYDRVPTDAAYMSVSLVLARAGGGTINTTEIEVYGVRSQFSAESLILQSPNTGMEAARIYPQDVGGEAALVIDPAYLLTYAPNTKIVKLKGDFSVDEGVADFYGDVNLNGGHLLHVFGSVDVDNSNGTGIDLNDSAIQMRERTQPAAPPTDEARIYLQDNGAGKTQLRVRFATGAVQILATQP